MKKCTFILKLLFSIFEKCLVLISWGGENSIIFCQKYLNFTIHFWLMPVGCRSSWRGCSRWPRRCPKPQGRWSPPGDLQIKQIISKIKSIRKGVQKNKNYKLRTRGRDGGGDKPPGLNQNRCFSEKEEECSEMENMQKYMWHFWKGIR